jgi:hypothetical protein
MNTITYNIKIGGVEKAPHLVQSDNTLNTIYAVDTRSLNKSLFNIRNTSKDNENRFIKFVSKTIKGMTVRSNSENILITDIYDNGTPLYRKTPIRFKEYDYILINGVKPVSDSNFLYTNDDSVHVSYYKNNLLILEYVDTTYPVYINSSYKNYESIYSIDGKVFKSVFDKDHYTITWNNTETSYKVLDTPIFNVSEYSIYNTDMLSLFINSFIMKRKGINYSTIRHGLNLVKVENEIAKYSNNEILLKNSGVSKTNIKISFIKDGVSVKDILGNSLENYEIEPKYGSIKLHRFKEEISAISYDKVIVDYHYYDFISNNIKIPRYIVDSSEYISVGLTKDGLKYYAYDSFGFIIFSNHKINNLPYAINLVDKSTLKWEISGQPENSGNMYTGEKVAEDFIEISKISIKDMSKLKYVLNKRPSLPISGGHGLREIYIPNLAYCRIVIGKEKESYFNSGVSELNVGMSTQGTLSLYMSTDTKVVFQLDYSKDKYSDDVEYVDEDMQKDLDFKNPTFINKDPLKYEVIYIDGKTYSKLNSIKKHYDDKVYFIVNKEDINPGYRFSVVYGDSIPTMVHKI